MNMLTLLYFVISIQLKKKDTRKNTTKLVATKYHTSGIHLSRCTYNTCIISPNRQKYIFQPHQSPSGLSTPEKTKVFRIYKTVWFKRENTFQTTRRKRLRIPSRTNLRRYLIYFYRSRVCVFSTLCLVVQTNLTVTTSTAGMRLSRCT